VVPDVAGFCRFFRLQIPDSVLLWFNSEYDVRGMRFHIVLSDLS